MCHIAPPLSDDSDDALSLSLRQCFPRKAVGGKNRDLIERGSGRGSGRGRPLPVLRLGGASALIYFFFFLPPLSSPPPFRSLHVSPRNDDQVRPHRGPIVSPSGTLHFDTDGARL